MDHKENTNINKNNIITTIIKDINNANIGLIITLLILLACFVSSMFYIEYATNIEIAKNMKKHKQIIKKVNSILNKKTKHKTSMAYLFGVYSKNSTSKDKAIIRCYNKFHTIKLTATCLKGRI